MTSAHSSRKLLTLGLKTCSLFMLFTKSLTSLSVPYQALVRSIQQGEKEEMDAIVELLKIIVGLLIMVGIIRYCMNGLPPRGKGRWRRVLSDLELRDPPDNHTPGTRKMGSAPDRLNGNGK